MASLAKKIIRQRLEEIERAPVNVEWGYYSDDQDSFRVSLPHGCYHGGSLMDTGDRVLLYDEDAIFVPHELRGNGIGARLGKAMFSVALSQGAVRYRTTVTSEYSLALAAGIGTAIDFIDDYSGGHMPLTFDQAVSSLQRASHYEPDADNRDIGIEIAIDLSTIDTTDWEEIIVPPRPTPTPPQGLLLDTP